MQSDLELFLDEPEPGKQASDCDRLEQHERNEPILYQPEALSKTVERWCRRPKQCLEDPRNAKGSQPHVPRKHSGESEEKGGGRGEAEPHNRSGQHVNRQLYTMI